MGIFIPKAATPVQANRIIAEAVAVETRFFPSASRAFHYSRKSCIKGRVIAVPPQAYVNRIPRSAVQLEDFHPKRGFVHSSASTIDSADGHSDGDDASLESKGLPETSAGEIGWIVAGEKNMARWRRARVHNPIVQYAERFLVQTRRSPFQKRSPP